MPKPHGEVRARTHTASGSCQPGSEIKDGGGASLGNVSAVAPRRLKAHLLGPWGGGLRPPPTALPLLLPDLKTLLSYSAAEVSALPATGVWVGAGGRSAGRATISLPSARTRVSLFEAIGGNQLWPRLPDLWLRSGNVNQRIRRQLFSPEL